MKSLLSCFFVASGLTLAAGSAAAESFPDRPLKILSAFPAGGSTDIIARTLAAKLQASTGQPVVVENRVGATGSIAVQGVTSAAADGYTMLFHTSALIITPWLSKVPYDPLRDLIPLTRPAMAAYVFVVRPTLPIKNLKDFVDYAREHPGKLSCSTYGVGSPPHLALEMLKKAAGIDVLHVPYRGFAQALPDMASGQLDCGIDTQMNYQPHILSGAVRAVAITDSKPSKVFPQADPIGAVYPNAKVLAWQGMFVKAGTPADIVEKLGSELRKAIQMPDVQERMTSTGFEPVGDTPQEFAAVYRQDYEAFGNIIKERGIATQ
ncbi:tripartite tricarboxylate transporter substrate-binding protein [Pigmentiphaga sp.]|uniref:Bug family tripartite tricarboxylate transporter substrate binding protein n=1 Tax=Pigmentiphaga sp. TaxID=1977564 RepID=UPI0025E01508|nr:tripartite tricarboxylate transporter substrate-binding protein [Pigmentiphaga sp.]